MSGLWWTGIPALCPTTAGRELVPLKTTKWMDGWTDLQASNLTPEWLMWLRSVRTSFRKKTVGFIPFLFLSRCIYYGWRKRQHGRGEACQGETIVGYQSFEQLASQFRIVSSVITIQQVRADRHSTIRTQFLNCCKLSGWRKGSIHFLSSLIPHSGWQNCWSLAQLS